MPLHLLDFPEEILDSIIGSLLPELDPDCPLRLIEEHPLPLDLLHYSLVCEILHRIASLWLCHRFDLCEPRGSRSDDQHQRARAKVTFFSAHPEYAHHVRLLHIDYRRSSFEVFTQAINLIPAVQLPPFFASMSNLRVLILRSYWTCTTLPAEVFKQLMLQPQLHTVILDRLPMGGEIDWSQVDGPLLNLNIRNLSLRNPRNVMPLISLSPSLETLSLSSCPSLHHILTSWPFPWRTLRQLQLQNLEDWAILLDSYKEFRETTNSLPTPFVEFMITNGHMENHHIHHVLTTLSGQPLRKIMLCYVKDLDCPLLERIVAAFPQLREIGLLTTPGLRMWNGGVTSYAAILGRLPELQALHWNRVQFPLDPRRQRPQPDVSDFDVELSPVVTVLARNCPNLARLRFIDKMCRVSRTALIIRNETGKYRDHVLKTFLDGCHLFTSTWHDDQYYSLI